MAKPHERNNMMQNDDELLELTVYEQSRVNAQVRHANHTALTDSLMDFKQNRDLEQLFAKYGTPLIKRTGSCDPKESNVDIYLQ